MATRNGLVKKTPLSEYSRPKKTGIIAINLKEGDELVSVAVAKPGDEVILSSAKGQAVRFKQSTVRSSGRNAQGVKGIKLRKDDFCVGMVVAEPDATLLTVCEKGYGKRTPIGPNSGVPDVPESETIDEAAEAAAEAEETTSEEDESTNNRYPTKGRGTMGVRDIKTTERNGPVVAIVVVRDDDELLMMTARGKLQRIAASDISVIGRNTQGVRIMSLDEGDALVAAVRVPKDEDASSSSEPSSEENGTKP
jgi:DNA gyrase subunit A